MSPLSSGPRINASRSSVDSPVRPTKSGSLKPSLIRNALIKHLDELDQLPVDQLIDNRQRRLASFGKFKET